MGRVDVKVKRQEVIDRAQMFEGLLVDPAFIAYTDILKSKRQEQLNVLTKPKRIGEIEKISIDQGKQTKILKYTKEEDTERIKEAQIRYDNFTMVITMIENLVKYADYLQKVKDLEDNMVKEAKRSKK